MALRKMQVDGGFFRKLPMLNLFDSVPSSPH
jgi:hypothetical protein